MKRLAINIFCAAAALILSAACQKQPDVFQRDTDAISVDCNAQSITHYVLVSGHWTLETDEDWLSFTPAEGDGDGVLFQSYLINIAYNKGEAREGVYYLCHNGQRASVIVSQGECNFKYGKVSIEGSFVRDEASTARVLVAYSGASGEESISYSAVLSGVGAAGLSIPDGTYSSLTPGSGNISIPIEGTPTAEGDFSVEIKLDGKSVGSASATVAAPAVVIETTVLAKWTFAEASNADKKAELTAAYPSWASDHYLDAFEGKGRLSISEPEGKTLAKVTGCSFADGHLYFKGMQQDDAVLFTVPCTLSAGSAVTFKGCMGGAGSSAAYYLAEYSLDGSTWTECPGATTSTFYAMTFNWHCKTEDNITDCNNGNFNVTFTPGAVTDKLYVRLRVPANLRMNHTEGTQAINTSPASSRFKGELSLVASEAGGASGLSGIPCGWNLYALGMDAAAAQGSDYAKNWFNNLESSAYVPATMGDNSGAKFESVFVSGTCAGRTFNPSMQAKGLLPGDYWLATIPVTGLAAGTKLDIEVACGGAGGSVGYYLMEYSADAFTWTEVPGAVEATRGTDTFKTHLWNTPSSISMTGYTNTRKTYDKTTDDTHHIYQIEAPAIESGNLYFRLVVLKYRATPDSTAEVSAGWTDIKGFEVTVAK